MTANHYLMKGGAMRNRKIPTIPDHLGHLPCFQSGSAPDGPQWRQQEREGVSVPRLGSGGIHGSSTSCEAQRPIPTRPQVGPTARSRYNR